MILAGRDLLSAALRRHPDAAAWMERWAATVARSQWRNLLELRRDFPTADGVKLPDDTVVTVFNVRGNRFRLITRITYAVQIVRIVDLLTHAEYDKNQWKVRR